MYMSTASYLEYTRPIAKRLSELSLIFMSFASCIHVESPRNIVKPFQDSCPDFLPICPTIASLDERCERRSPSNVNNVSQLCVHRQGTKRVVSRSESIVPS